MNTINRYFDLSEAQKLALTQQQFEDSVKIEAIHRGIKPAITLPEAIRQHEFVGYHLPAEAVLLHEIVVSKNYGGLEATGIAYSTPEAARKALEGAYHIDSEGYGATAKRVIKECELTIREVRLTLFEPKQWNAAVKEFLEDAEPFTNLLDECTADLSEIRSNDYLRKIRANKRAEYLRLAGGNEDVAKAFWGKTEGSAWPDENGVQH